MITQSHRAVHQTLDECAITASSITQDHQVSKHVNEVPYVDVVPDALLIEQARALIITAKFLYHITVTFHALPDGTYEVAPVGDNSFTTITSASHLCSAILDQITTFMESPVFIEQQTVRLQRLMAKSRWEASHE